jgi:DNA-binding response OmpR family regulator
MVNPFGLVVDDDPDVRFLFAEVLRRAGMRIIEASSGNEALRIAETAGLAFVVTDVEMPDGNGWALCRTLRASIRPTRLPIVVVTGGIPLSQASEAVNAGCDVVLAKPCSPALLLQTIRQLLRSNAPPDPDRP